MTRATRSGPRELAESVGTKARELAGMVRRMIVTRARGAVWQILDHDMSAIGGEERPTKDAEVFTGIGFASRPSSSGDVEAIVAFPGGPGNPIIVATRQEATRRIVAADLDADETQIHNSQTLIRIMADGSVEIRSSGGTAQPLATLADLEALRDYIETTMVVTCPAGTSTPGTSDGGVPDPDGTSVLKAE